MVPTGRTFKLRLSLNDYSFSGLRFLRCLSPHIFCHYATHNQHYTNTAALLTRHIPLRLPVRVTGNMILAADLCDVPAAAVVVAHAKVQPCGQVTDILHVT